MTTGTQALSLGSGHDVEAASRSNADPRADPSGACRRDAFRLCIVSPVTSYPGVVQLVTHADHSCANESHRRHLCGHPRTVPSEVPKLSDGSKGQPPSRPNSWPDASGLSSASSLDADEHTCDAPKAFSSKAMKTRARVCEASSEIYFIESLRKSSACQERSQQ